MEKPFCEFYKHMFVHGSYILKAKKKHYNLSISIFYFIIEKIDFDYINTII